MFPANLEGLLQQQKAGVYAPGVSAGGCPEAKGVPPVYGYGRMVSDGHTADDA
jgi:hypothetical protein